MYRALCFGLCLVFLDALAAGTTHPLEVPQPQSAPDVVLAGIEIPANGFSKYEVSPTHGHLVLDRFVTMPVVYPTNYGFLPSTKAGDGDALDVLVLSREPIIPGAFVRVRPIGILHLIDDGARDDKIIAVPADDVDPEYVSIRELGDLADAEKNRIEAFFQTYKNLPEPGGSIEVEGFGDAESARKAITEAMKTD